MEGSGSDHRVTEADDGWADACERLGVDRDAARRATDDFLFLDFPLRNTDRHCNNLGLIRDVEAFAIRPAPIFDSGASPRNGMEPDAMNNGDCRTKPFRIDDRGDGDNAYRRLSLIDDRGKYDPDRLADVPAIIHDQPSSDQRLSPVVTERIVSAMRERSSVIRDRRDVFHPTPHNPPIRSPIRKTAGPIPINAVP